MKRRGLPEGKKYLAQYPRLQRWVWECAACGVIGHKPSMPAPERPPRGASVAALRIHNQFLHLREFFPVLRLDERGLCESCRSVGPDLGPRRVSPGQAPTAGQPGRPPPRS
jgi:hypothetical protein